MKSVVPIGLAFSLVSFFVNAQVPKGLHAFKKSRAYYVSNNGNDLNPGTKQQPLKSIFKINHLTLVAGDTLFFDGRSDFTGTLHLNISATENKPVLITSYGLGRAIIHGRQKEAIILEGAHFILKDINV